MANPTTNFGWVMPTSASLVTNLPADFNVFGQAVDTSMQYLLGGTTGQILSKTSGTNMAFTWIANDQGDITGVTAGTGISVSSPTGPVPTVSIDTAVTADLTTAQTLTNKKLSDSTTTIVDVTDATKAIKFDVAGTTGITGTIATAFTTAKTVTIPDTTGTVALTNGVINNTLLTTTGDTIYASSANTPARLAAGTAGYVLTSGGAGVAPSWAAAAGGGKVLQVVQATQATGLSSSTTSYVTTGLSASITPTLNTSKIMVLVMMPVSKSNANANNCTRLQLKRGSSIVLVAPATAQTLAASYLYCYASLHYLDAPATTSSTTYTVEFSNAIAASAVLVMEGDSTSTIILMEIGA